MKFNKNILIIFALVVFSFLFLINVQAEDIDSDGDGYGDQQEIANGYSPYTAEPLKLTENDADQDGLSDYWELQFQTNALEADSDQDGYSDGLEVDNTYNPLSPLDVKLPQRVEIDLTEQKLFYFVNDYLWKEFLVSTGKPGMTTPKGEFEIINKNPKAWSNAYKLWMPYWLGLGNGIFGIHELPLWPNGYREGENHLGKAVSHGCIRLGIGPAQYLYERLETGMKVLIK